LRSTGAAGNTGGTGLDKIDELHAEFESSALLRAVSWMYPAFLAVNSRLDNRDIIANVARRADVVTCRFIKVLRPEAVLNNRQIPKTWAIMITRKQSFLVFQRESENRFLNLSVRNGLHLCCAQEKNGKGKSNANVWNDIDEVDDYITIVHRLSLCRYR
jgi:hypothetical protein